MNIIKFNLPINTKLVGVKAVEKNELYFKTERNRDAIPWLQSWGQEA